MGSLSRRVVAAGMACLLGLGVIVVTAPSANAAANRRICAYSYAHANYLTATGNVFSHYQWVMNYKKDGGCPTNTEIDSFGSGAFPHDVAKVTCEAFAATAKINYDPCPRMVVDSLYYVEWYENGNATTFTNHGHY
jgi:hypothetical protein